MRRFVYSTRGLYLLVAQGTILWLKHYTGTRVPLPLYIALLLLVIAAQFFRTWAAGFVGTAARGRETHAEVLLTAGPYAYLRNPMYFGGFLITTGLALMSGLVYAPLIAWAAYAFVYSNVIPYEEAFLKERFGNTYEEYRLAVPQLLPMRHGYPWHQGSFQLREALANEVAAWAGVVVFGYLYWYL